MVEEAAMAEDVTQELLHELLRRLHTRFDKIDNAINEMRSDNLFIRGQIHNLQGDVNNIRGSMAQMDQRLDRIENRLELRELAEAQARFEPHP
jgi:small-conductance mechanosensitive channel